MDIVLMRHGRAIERGTEPDEQRGLTTDGIKRLGRALPGLRQVVPRIDRVVTSPLLRARQTADMVAEGYAIPVAEMAALSPGGDPREITRWLSRHEGEVFLLVGHEPDLGRLASWYLTGSSESFLPLKKGAICLIHFEGKPAPTKGELRLLFTAGQLRRITG